MTPALKKIYIGREIAAAGTGLILHTVKTCGMNADVVQVPANNPRISIRFIENLSCHFIQNVGKAFMECKKTAVILPPVKRAHEFTVKD